MKTDRHCFYLECKSAQNILIAKNRYQLILWEKKLTMFHSVHRDTTVTFSAVPLKNWRWRLEKFPMGFQVTSDVETRLEFSSNQQPMHHAMFSLKIGPDNLSYFKTRVGVLYYTKRRIFPCTKLSSSTLIQFLTNVSAKYI